MFNKSIVLCILCLVFFSLLHAEKNPLIREGEDIVDIGKKDAHYVEVPLETVFYTPNMMFVGNVLAYAPRNTNVEDCYTDELTHETCPIDEEECEGFAEYNQGNTVSSGTGYISCSSLHSLAYWDNNLKKCVLPPIPADVCKDYKNSRYDAEKDKCVVGTISPLIKQKKVMLTDYYFFRHLDSIDSYLANFLPVIEAAGGTFLKSERITNLKDAPSWWTAETLELNIGFKIRHDAKVPFAIDLEQHDPPSFDLLFIDMEGHVIVEPGKEFFLTRHAYDAFSSWSIEGDWDATWDELYNKATFSTAWNPNITFSTTEYYCADTLIWENGKPYCSTEKFYAPRCSNEFFPTRKNAKCLGDKKQYDYFNYQCNDDQNVYGNGWEINDIGGDCGEYALEIDTDGDGIKDRCNLPNPPMENCYRSSYKCPFNAQNVCGKKIKTLEHNSSAIGGEEDEESKITLKRPLQENGVFRGGYKEAEYGAFRQKSCAEGNNQCPYALDKISTIGNQLCFQDKVGNKECVEVVGNCKFSGEISDVQVNNPLLFSFLNNPDEDVTIKDFDYQKDFDSPTLISLNFQKSVQSYYPLKQVKFNPEVGEQITVDFWMYWRGMEEGEADEYGDMPIGLGRYNIWMRGADSFGTDGIMGFNTGQEDIYGIEGINTLLVNKWVKVTVIFTHKDFTKNKLYINGIEMALSEQHPDNIFHDNNTSELDQVLHLGNSHINGKYSFNGKIAGVNVYDGALSSKEIKALYEKGSNRGINLLRVYENKIEGYNSDGEKSGVITAECGTSTQKIFSGKVGYIEVGGNHSQIIAAKSINNRLMFWDSYSKNGNIGHIEILKSVSNKDATEGFVFSPEIINSLYDKGFTGFISQNGKTYAVAADSINIATCESKLEGTKWYLAERNADDLDGSKIINALSYYSNGEFGEHCLIETNEEIDNQVAEFAIKEITNKGALVGYYCSPWGCDSHRCGVASCQDGWIGNELKPTDLEKIDSSVCIDQLCDMSQNYFKFCGNLNGCSDDPSITQVQDGSCKQAICSPGDQLNYSVGKCEKIGCKYIERDGKCFKELY